MSTRRSIVRTFIVVASTGIMMTALASPSEAVLVQTSYRKLNGGRADFGAGTHSFGSPQDSATVKFDFAYNASGDLITTARVQGTLYWDSLTNAGCARLTITFKDGGVPGILATRTVDRCGPGGNANDAANKRAVDETFSARRLEVVDIAANEVVNGVVLAGAETGALRPTTRTFPVKIDNGLTDFGSGTHAFGAPTGDGTVELVTPLGTFPPIEGHVTGRLYWDSAFSSGCARMVIDFRATDNTVLDSRTRDNCGPGGNANDDDNNRSIDVSHSGDPLWNIRLRVGTLAGSSFVGVTSRTFDFNGPVGTSELAPVDVTVAADELLRYQFTWTVPEPENWHDLESLQLRVRNDEGTVFWLLWDEESNTFSVFNDAAGRFGRAFPAGSPARLQTPYATLHLGASSVEVVNSALGRGAASPGVMLTLALTFKPSAAGRTFTVDVAGSDDSGNDDPFVEAGRITVTPLH